MSTPHVTDMSQYTRIAAVTGSNKGIGLACVRQLALQYPKSSYNTGPLLIYLTARDEGRGREALKSIHNDAQLKSAKALRSQGGLTDVEYLPLDINSESSIQSFSESIKKSHPSGIDFLINNAGIAMSGFNNDIVKQTLHCNYYGTLNVCRALLPHIKEGGRLVNVASMSGHLSNKYSSTIKSRFLNATKVDDITGIMQAFEGAVREDKYKNDFPGAAYAVSKAGVIGVSKVLAEEAYRANKVLVNSCCPGYVRTDMTKGGGVKSVDQGALTPVLLAIGEISGAYGKFWQNERVIEW